MRRLLAGDSDDALPNQLLNEIFAGFSVERLRALVTSENVSAVEAAAWIMSESGASAKPMLDDAVVIRRRVAVVAVARANNSSALLARAAESTTLSFESSSG